MFGPMWWGLVIPLIASIILMVFFKRYTAWWELVILWGCALICIIIAQLSVEYVAKTDTEWWGNLGIKATHEPTWSEWVINGCSESIPCGTDSKGNTTYCTRWYDCMENHSRQCFLVDRQGQKTYVSYAKYKEVRNRWGKDEQFVNMYREKNHDVTSHGARDADMYVTHWDKDPFHSEPIASTHSYENRVAVSDSIFNYPELDEKEVEFYGLHEYPEDYPGYELVTILDTKNWKKADTYFRYLNGKLGPKRLLRIWVMVFRDQPRDAAFKQQAYWKNGNKNEFIFCIGVNKDLKIKWGETISWTEVESLKTDARGFIERKMGDTLNNESLLNLAKWSEKELGTKYVKPEFTDMWKHLKVKPSPLAMTIAFIIILLINGGVCFWIVRNQYLEEGALPRFRSRR